ncbi:hypothetical protein EGJ86_17015 [Pseudomonas sp. o96-267]|nr:hypothetical protein EGJ86_17015 [Pseudomonas sp. o96-267]
MDARSISILEIDAARNFYTVLGMQLYKLGHPMSQAFLPMLMLYLMQFEKSLYSQSKGVF